MCYHFLYDYKFWDSKYFVLNYFVSLSSNTMPASYKGPVTESWIKLNFPHTIADPISLAPCYSKESNSKAL